MDAKYLTALADLNQSQAEDLSILRLAHPVTSIVDARKRTSDASIATDNPSPASLNEDLNHYRELFSKLRFSYVEQVTKEKFLRAIVGEPPQIVEHQENIELEQRLAGQKADLKAQKLAVAKMVETLEAQSLQLSERHERIETQASQLSQIPVENEGLKELIATFRAQQPEEFNNPSLSLPLEATRELVNSRQSELELLGKRLRTLQQALPRKSHELELLENELRPLDLQRAGTIAAAEEARQRHEQGERGRGDDLELKGRWYRNVDLVLRDLLKVENA